MTTCAYRKYRGVTHAALALTTLASLTVSGALLTGCGGGSKSVTGSATRAARGRASLSIAWPKRKTGSRLIPLAANSIVVSFVQNGFYFASQVIQRPADGVSTTVPFDNLPTGDFIVQIDAYPSDDGSGTADATATAPITILPDVETPLDITLASTIDRLSVASPPNAIPIGGTATLLATAYDVNDNVVLTNAITFASQNPNVATVDGTGKVTAVSGGTATILVTETESGKTANVTINVSSSTGVTVSPATTTVAVNGKVTFTATVDTATDQSVTWSVPANSGTITAAGVYTAPATPNTYTITATSVADHTAYGTATVTVQ